MSLNVGTSIYSHEDNIHPFKQAHMIPIVNQFCVIFYHVGEWLLKTWKLRIDHWLRIESQPGIYGSKIN